MLSQESMSGLELAGCQPIVRDPNIVHISQTRKQTGPGVISLPEIAFLKYMLEP